jgi:hypothetical protein
VSTKPRGVVALNMLLVEEEMRCDVMMRWLEAR